MKKALILAFLASLSAALAQETFFFTAHLSNSNLAMLFPPPVTGEGHLSLTGSSLAYEITVPFAFRLCEIRGPAAPGMNGPTIFDLGSPGCATPLPPSAGACFFRGTQALSDAQATDLKAGLWYANAVFLGRADYNLRGQILLDSDQDGVPDDQDQCANTDPGALVDANGCSIEQLCPCDHPWKNHGEYVKCVKAATAEFVQQGLLTESGALVITQQTATSNCGRAR